MNEGNTVKQIYYGWLVVVMAMIIYAIVVGTTAGAFGVFVVPVAADLNLSRAEMNTALIFQHLGNALLAPAIGRSLDRVSVKLVMIVSSIFFGLSFVALGLSHSLWISALIMAVGIPIGYLGSGSLTNSVLIARWFVAHRGRAMLLTGLGMSGGTMIMPPLVALLVEEQGWRAALLIMGLIAGALLLTFALIIRDRPGPNDVEVTHRSDDAAQIVGQSHRDPVRVIRVSALLRTLDFWLMGLSTAIAVSVSQSLVVTLVPLGHDMGLSTLEAASLISVLGGAAIAGGLLLSVIADRISRVILLTGLFLLQALVNGMLLLDKSYVMLVACAATLGVISGTLVHAFYALLADRFGSTSMGTVRGVTFFLFGVLGMIFLRFSGEVFDRTGSYDLMFAAFVIAQLVAAILMFATRIFHWRTTSVRTQPMRG
jgi:sugar phosphate permease